MIGKQLQDKELRVRLSEFDLSIIDAFCKTQNQSRTKTVKKAIKSYIYLNIENRERPNKKVLFSQNMLKPLLDNANEKLIEKIAEISFNNGISDTNFLQKTLLTIKDIKKEVSAKPLLKSILELNLEERIKGLIEGVFSPGAQNWFESIKSGWNGNILILGGKHNLGHNFSLFFKHLMIKYMEVYEYKFQNENYRETKSKTEGKNPIYTVILHFVP